jgi:hypothetical protein
MSVLCHKDVDCIVRNWFQCDLREGKVRASTGGDLKGLSFDVRNVMTHEAVFSRVQLALRLINGKFTLGAHIQIENDLACYQGPYSLGSTQSRCFVGCCYSCRWGETVSELRSPSDLLPIPCVIYKYKRPLNFSGFGDCTQHNITLFLYRQ